MDRTRFDDALELRKIIVSLGTSGPMDELEFRGLRAKFIDDPITRNFLPRFVRDNVDGVGLWTYLKDFHTGSGAYQARRKHITEQFEPLLNYLSQAEEPADADVTASLSQYNAAGITELWQKALIRRKTDPEGAITAARSLLEEVCKHILEDADKFPSEKWNLPKIYSEASKIMNLSPSQHNEEIFKNILGGCQTIVENLGRLRNQMSDAHGGGRRKIKPAERHAKLAVNLAGSMAMFLIETWTIKQMKTQIEDAKATTTQIPTSYKNVHLSSRYDLASEIEKMKEIVDALSPDMARRIETIWCDSKATAVYSVTVRKGQWIPNLQWEIADAGHKVGGHNGFFFDGDAPNGTYLDPDWPEIIDQGE